MTSRSTTRTIGTLIAVLPALTLACGAAPGESSLDDDEFVASNAEALAAYTTLFHTYDSPGTVDICFLTNDAGGWVGAHEIRADQAMDALEDSWGAVTGLTFNRIQCTAPGPLLAIKLILTITTGPAESQGGSCWYGVGTTCPLTVPMALSTEGFMGTVAHEVGHALYMAHEHQRSVTLPDGTLAHEVPLCPDEAARLAAGVAPSDRVPAAFPPITTEYDRCSIQNYCRAAWGCVSAHNMTVAKWADGLAITPLDALGAEVLYPTGDNVPLGCHKGCFLTGDGVLVRTSGEIRDSWTARGANDWTSYLAWNNSFVGPIYVPGPISSYIEFWGTSKYHNNGQAIEGGGYVRSHNSEWTALALAIL